MCLYLYIQMLFVVYMLLVSIRHDTPSGLILQNNSVHDPNTRGIHGNELSNCKHGLTNQWALIKLGEALSIDRKSDCRDPSLAVNMQRSLEIEPRGSVT